MKFTKNFLRSHKTIILSIGFLTIFSFAVAHANPPASQYTPGSTLDPQCAPGSTNCTVALPTVTVQAGGVAYGNTDGTLTSNSTYFSFNSTTDTASINKIATTYLSVGSNTTLDKHYGSVFAYTYSGAVHYDGVLVEPTFTPSADLSNEYKAFKSDAIAVLSGQNMSSLGGGVVGGDLSARPSGTGTVTTVGGVQGYVYLNPTSTLAIHTAFGGWFYGPAGSTIGTNTVTNSISGLFQESYGATNEVNAYFGPSDTGSGAVDVTLIPGNYSLYDASTRNNYFNGNIGIANAAPAYLLHVGSSTTANGIVAEFQTSAANCTLNPAVTGGLTCSSDMNLKKNITNLADNSPWNFNDNISFNNQSVLDEVLALNPVQYNWKTETDGTTKHDGFIAQEVQQIFPSLVMTDPHTGLLSLDYTGLIPYTVAAIQQMNMNITSIDDLTKSDSWRDALTSWFGDMNNGITDFFSKNISSDHETTNELCVGTACVTQQQFLQMIQSAGQSSSNPTSDTTISNAGATSTESPDVSVPVVTPPDQTDTSDVATPTIDPDTSN